VLDVPPKLGARVRLLAAGDVNKNDPNDARSVAVAALRSPGAAGVRPDDHAAVLKIWSKRHRDLGRTRTRRCSIFCVSGAWDASVTYESMAERTHSVSTMESSGPAGGGHRPGLRRMRPGHLRGFCDCDHGDPAQEEVEGAAAEAAGRLAELVSPAAVDKMLADAEAAGMPLDGAGGLLSRLTRTVLERALGAELDDHLGYVRGDPAGNGSGNSRNGFYGKTVTTAAGPVRLAVPRDRAPRSSRRSCPRASGGWARSMT
jgi:Transposase, Mutator family